MSNFGAENISKKIKALTFGYIRQIEVLLPKNSELYQNIPLDIKYLCALYSDCKEEWVLYLYQPIEHEYNAQDFDLWRKILKLQQKIMYFQLDEKVINHLIVNYQKKKQRDLFNRKEWNKYGTWWCECSAKTGDNVNVIFTTAAETIK